MRAVLDTNIVISAVLSIGGAPWQCLEGARTGLFELITSSALLLELEIVLRRQRILLALGWTDLNVIPFVEDLAGLADVVIPEVRLTVLADDDDNRVLEAATAGQADYIVTGDRALLDLSEFEGVQIVSPARFVTILKDVR